MAKAEARKPYPEPRCAETCDLVRAAADGDAWAWKALVERYDDLVRAVALGHRLTDTDVADVVQTTWLRAVEHLKSMRQPERIGSWLVTVARRECLKTIRTGARHVPTNQEQLTRQPDTSSALDAQLLAAEKKAMVDRAWATLSLRDRGLLRLLHCDAPLSYEVISTAFEMPIGSIGPTRGRALQRLRDNLAAA